MESSKHSLQNQHLLLLSSPPNNSSTTAAAVRNPQLYFTPNFFLNSSSSSSSLDHPHHHHHHHQELSFDMANHHDLQNFSHHHHLIPITSSSSSSSILLDHDHHNHNHVNNYDHNKLFTNNHQIIYPTINISSSSSCTSTTTTNTTFDMNLDLFQYSTDPPCHQQPLISLQQDHQLHHHHHLSNYSSSSKSSSSSSTSTTSTGDLLLLHHQDYDHDHDHHINYYNMHQRLPFITSTHMTVLPLSSSTTTGGGGGREIKRSDDEVLLLESTVIKESPEEAPPYKRSRLLMESRASTCTPFKVRKEKLGDRIAALQQLVAPFGKTDTASVLMEAIGYIKFLQNQVETLSVPYLKSLRNKTHNHHQRGVQMGTLIANEERKRDLKSRGLCLVPLSCLSYITDTGGAVWPPPPPNFAGGT